MAHAWLKYKESGKLDDLKNFRNQYAAEPWVESTRPARKTPSSPCATTAHAGRFPARWTEKSGYPSFWPRWTRSSTISGTSSGPTAMAKPRRAGSVASGSADNLAALEEILFGSVYADPDGREYAVKGSHD